MHLSLSLSLSCPSSTSRLTGQNGRFSTPLAGYGTPRSHARCSKLPSHALGDVRRPREVARDRDSAYTHANVRQAHRQLICRAPGGVAGQPNAFFSPREWTCRAPGGVAGSPPRTSISNGERVFSAPRGVAGSPSAFFSHREWTYHAPGGVAGQQRTSLVREIWAPGVPDAATSSPDRLSGSGRVSTIRRPRHPHLAAAVEEAPGRAPTRTGRCSGRRGLNPRPRRPRLCSNSIACVALNAGTLNSQEER